MTRDRWPGVRWFVWLPSASRTRPNARPWIVSTRQAPVVTFTRPEEHRP